MIHIIFSDTRNSLGIGAFFIKLWQRNKDFSHVALRFYDVRIREHIVIESSHGEVHLMEWNNWKKKNITRKEVAVEVTDDELVQLLKKAIKFLQLPYSFKNIIGIVFKKILGRKLFDDNAKAFICSELVGTLLVDKYNFPKDLDFTTPADIYDVIVKGL